MKKRITLEMICAAAWLTWLLTSSLVMAQKIELTPTFESISVELPMNVNSASKCEVKYKPSGGEWQDGLDLFVDRYTDSGDQDKGFRGSIVLLKPNTTYEVELRYAIDGRNFQSPISKTVTTWSEEFTGQTIKIKDRDDLERELSKLKSGPTGDRYVILDGRINGNERALIDGKREDNAIKLEGHRYVVLRNMRFTGGDGSAIHIKKSHHIVVEDCEIYNWGVDDSFCKSSVNGFNGDSRKIAGVLVNESSQVVVQRNNIHDPTSNSCHWESIPKNSHPNGPRGIALVNRVAHSVFRYNRVHAAFEDRRNHYFSDVFNGETEGTERDIDIYGNEFANAWDDGIEIEGLNRNIRVWNNVVHHTYQGVASDRDGGKGAKLYSGPVYIWRNIITELYKTPGGKEGRSAFKIENNRGFGGIYLFNNTISGLKVAGKSGDGLIDLQDGFSQAQYNLTAKNNIFEIHDENLAYGTKMRSANSSHRNSLNYNAYSHSKTSHMRENGWEKDSKFDVNFTYQKGNNEWDYYVQGSGKGAGTRIPNFIDPPAGVAVDLGAAQKDVWSMCVGPEADCTNDTNNPPPKPEPEPEPPAEPVEAVYAAVPAERAPSLGQSYWANVPGHTFADPTGRSDNRVEFKAIWNEDYLIIGVSVDDRLPLMADPQNDPWRNDAVQLLFDPDNTRGQDWNHHQLGHRQLIQDVRGKRYSYPQGFGDQSRPYGKTTTFGYLLEVRIPWSALGEDINAMPGLQLGFDVANDDLDESADGQKKYQFTYTGRVEGFRVPARFATLKLGEKEGEGSLSARVFSGAGARQLAVYPNPTSEGSVQLQLSGFTGETQVQVTDTQGQVVYRGTHRQQQIQLGQHFPRGLYIVRVSDAQKTLTQKLLVE